MTTLLMLLLMSADWYLFVDDLVGKLAKREGAFVAGQIPNRLKNPCALSFAHQQGAVDGERHFAEFKTMADGWAACQRDVDLKRSRGISDAEIYRNWPKAEKENAK